MLSLPWCPSAFPRRLGGNSDNLESLLINLVQEYVPALKGADMSVEEPQLFPDTGIWHPLSPAGMYEDLKEYLNWYDTRKDIKFAPDAPVIGLVMQRSHLVTGDEGHYAGVVAELESRGAKVVAVFAGGLDFSSPVKKFFYDPINVVEPYVDTVVSLTGFALVGGPARQDAPKAIEALKALNVPYLCSLPLVFQTTEEWLDSELGVHPVQVALQVRKQAGCAAVTAALYMPVCLQTSMFVMYAPCSYIMTRRQLTLA